MTTPHTAALDHALAEALHHSDRPHADAVDVEVMVRADDGTPLRYRVAAWRGAAYWPAENADLMKALALAMRKLRADPLCAMPAAMGGIR